jgi:hypothetical protein
MKFSFLRTSHQITRHIQSSNHLSMKFDYLGSTSSPTISKTLSQSLNQSVKAFAPGMRRATWDLLDKGGLN